MGPMDTNNVAYLIDVTSVDAISLADASPALIDCMSSSERMMICRKTICSGYLSVSFKYSNEENQAFQ
ncbi:hypothetical protein D3C84_1288440 [compost metagenome]